MFALSIIVLIVAFAAYIAVAIWDTWRSLQQPLYTTGEATKHLRGQDGYFSFNKGLVFDVAFGIFPGLVFTFLFNPYAGALWYGTVALVLFIRLQKSWKNYQKAKKAQFELLAILKRDPAYRPEGMPKQFKFDDQFVWPTFYDIRVNSDEYYDTASFLAIKERLFEKLGKLAAKGSGEWWKKDRAKSL